MEQCASSLEDAEIMPHICHDWNQALGMQSPALIVGLRDAPSCGRYSGTYLQQNEVEQLSWKKANLCHK